MNRIFLTLFLFALTYPALADDICDKITPKTNKNADYIAGIDIKGKPVVSADTETIPSDKLWKIPITIDLAKRFGIILPEGVELKPEISQITIHQNGLIEYNNKNITQDVKRVCSDEKPPKPDGQSTSDTVISSDKIEGQYPDKE